MKKINELCVYNENCVLAGKAIRARDMNEGSGNEWHDEDVTETNAVEHEAIGGRYHNQIAATIREAL